MQDDSLLRFEIAKSGAGDWAKIAQKLPGRSSKGCSDR